MTQSWQRVGTLTELPGVLRDLAADPAAVAAEAGIDLAELADQNNQIPFRSACLLVTTAAERTGCDHVGLLIASRTDTRSIGVVGALMRNAPTLGRGLLDLCENHHRYVRGGVPYLVARDGYAWAGYAVYTDAGASVEHFQVAALAVGHSMARELSGATPEEVLLSRKAPADPQPYRQFFGAPVKFDADQTALVFSKATLDLPVLHADPAKRQILEAQVRDYWAVDLPSMSDRVVRLLRPRVFFNEDRLAGCQRARHASQSPRARPAGRADELPSSPEADASRRRPALAGRDPSEHYLNRSGARLCRHQCFQQPPSDA